MDVEIIDKPIGHTRKRAERKYGSLVFTVTDSDGVMYYQNEDFGKAFKVFHKEPDAELGHYWKSYNP